MKKEKIAIQGLKGSFHHEAAQHYFGESIELLECASFSDTIESVENDEATFAVFAIENSLAGSIIPNYNLIKKSKLQIVGEVGLRVKMNCVALKGDSLDEISEIRSHQMAIRQCGAFLEKYNTMKVVESFDTAGSAKQIKEYNQKGVAAIASSLAADEYGLQILAAGIEDHELNYTRFLILSGTEDYLPGKISNKASIYFQTRNEAGSLAKFLTVISGLDINLTKLQSHPVPSRNTLYGFYATLEIQSKEQLDNLKIMMKAMTIDFQVLGVYEKGETYG